MSVEIDTRPLWIILALKSLRPIFFLLLAILFWYFIKMPSPEGLTAAGQNAIAVFLICLILWVSNMIPLAITSIFAIILVPLLGILTKKETYSLFGNEAVFFILGAFILAGAVMHSGLSNRIALNVIKRYGYSPKRLLLCVFLLAAALSFFMSEHAVAAMLFPMLLELAKSLKLRPGKSNYGKFLFHALSWGCIVGGVATFLGGARVPLAMGILKETTGETIGFLDYTVAVLPLVFILLAVGFMILTVLYPIDVAGVDNAGEVIAKRLKELGKVSFSEYAVGMVLLLTIVGWISLGRTLGLAAVALGSVVILFVLRIVRWKDVEDYVNWGIILMYGGAITLGSALDKSGAAAWLIKGVIGRWSGAPWTIFALVSLLTIFLTEAMSHAAVIAVLLPVVIGMAGKMSVDPVVMTYSVATPAGLAFMLPMSTPANGIAVSSNYITVRDMIKGGLIMAIISWVLFNLMAAFYWPLIGFGRLR